MYLSLYASIIIHHPSFSYPMFTSTINRLSTLLIALPIFCQYCFDKNKVINWMLLLSIYSSTGSGGGGGSFGGGGGPGS